MTSSSEREGFDGMDKWSTLEVHSESHMIYRLLGRPEMLWKKLTENTVIGTSGDLASRL